jgi:hypothetical protein
MPMPPSPQEFLAACNRSPFLPYELPPADLANHRLIKLGGGRLLMIAGGRKTLDQQRAETKARVNKHRQKKLEDKRAKENEAEVKAKSEPLQAHVTASGNNVDPDVSTEGPAASKSAGKPKAAPMPSEVALAECKYSIDHRFPLMNAKDRTALLEYARALNVKLYAKEHKQEKAA